MNEVINTEEKTLCKKAIYEAVEAILFAAGYPIKIEKLAQTLGTTVSEMKKIISEFENEYNSKDNIRGIQLVVLDESVQLCTKEEYGDYIKTALGMKSRGKLSNSSLEVLAIIAYNQPTTKAFIEQIRGVDCTYAINNLLDKGLIEAKGRLDAPGKPIVYGTTYDFLRCFGLESVKELPKFEIKDGGENAPIIVTEE